MNLDALAPLAPLLILGLWSLLLVALARVDLSSGPGIHRPLALTGALLALLAALSLLGDPAHDVGTLLAGGGLVVDPLALFASVLILTGLVAGLLLARPGPHAGPRAALALLLAAGLLLAVHATDLLGLVAGLEVAGLGLCALLAVDRRTRAAAWDWLIGHGLSASLLLLGVALVVGATGTSRIADLGARVGMVFTRWGASPSQAAVDLLQSGVPIPEALTEQARTRAVTAMAPAALFIPGMLLTFAGLLARLGLAPFALAAGRVYERAPLAALALVELGLRLAALVALVRLFAGVFHVARQLHAPYGWSTAATLIAGLTLLVTAVQGLRQREPRRLLAVTAAALAAWSLLGLTAAANFYAHAQSHARTLTVVDHHEWGMRSGDHAIAAVLTLALAQALAALGLLAGLAALGDPAPGRGTLVFHGLARRRPLLAAALLVHLLALIGLPPTLAFAARLDLLAALLVDTNPAIRLLAALALLAACRGDVVCTLDVPGPSVVIHVKDAVTRLAPVDPPPGIIFTSGYSDSLHPYRFDGDGNWQMLAAGNRTGTFTARIEAPGYQVWERSGLHAEWSEGVCPNIIPAVADADLVRD